MAATLDSLHPPLFHYLDPISLILSQNSGPDQPFPLKLTSESYAMERGPKYRAYAELRESRLRMRLQEREPEPELKQNPVKKQVKFSPDLGKSRRGPSILAQSVPDFSAALRKENRKPPTTAPGLDLTPPSKNWGKAKGMLSNSRGSKSANAGEKKGLAMARKSYACVEELKGISSAAANAINGETRGRITRLGGNNKTILGQRQF